jgi:hypothetical protein
MAVRECLDGLGEQWWVGVEGIRNAWVRGSIPRGGSIAGGNGRIEVVDVPRASVEDTLTEVAV